jgi:hypothetical protein
VQVFVVVFHQFLALLGGTNIALTGSLSDQTLQDASQVDELTSCAMSLSKVPVLAVLLSFLGGIVSDGEKTVSVGIESKMMIESASW